MNSPGSKPLPCPVCREGVKLLQEIHVGTAFVECGKCHFRGPELIPGRDTKMAFSAVVQAWNNIAR